MQEPKMTEYIEESRAAREGGSVRDVFEQLAAMASDAQDPLTAKERRQAMNERAQQRQWRHDRRRRIQRPGR